MQCCHVPPVLQVHISAAIDEQCHEQLSSVLLLASDDGVYGGIASHFIAKVHVNLSRLQGLQKVLQANEWDHYMWVPFTVGEPQAIKVYNYYVFVRFNTHNYVLSSGVATIEAEAVASVIITTSA